MEKTKEENLKGIWARQECDAFYIVPSHVAEMSDEEIQTYIKKTGVEPQVVNSEMFTVYDRHELTNNVE